MSLIEEFKKAKATATRICRAVTCALGKDDPSNDKHYVRCDFLKLQDCDWSPMLFSVRASHGYYGNSSGYSDTSEELGRYLAKAINEQLPNLMTRAAALADLDAEKARKKAEDEARSVLQEAKTETV